VSYRDLFWNKWWIVRRERRSIERDIIRLNFFFGYPTVPFPFLFVARTFLGT